MKLPKLSSSDKVAIVFAILLVVSGVQELINKNQHSYDDKGTNAYIVIVLVFGGMLLGAAINKIAITARLQKIVPNKKEARK